MLALTYNDHEIETIIATVAKAGAQAANYILLRLPGEVKALFQEWLTIHYPKRAQKVLSLMANYRKGKLYSSECFKRMKGHRPYADLLEQRFTTACKRFALGIENTHSPQLRTDLFRPLVNQLSLF